MAAPGYSQNQGPQAYHAHQPGSENINFQSGPPRPAGATNYPPGLEYLLTVGQLFVKQRVSTSEVLSDWEAQNRYVVKSIDGKVVYSVREDSDECSRQCCGPNREFALMICDAQREVIRLHRPCNMTPQDMSVSSATGQPLGYVVPELTMMAKKFLILNANRQTVLRIQGPAIAIGTSEFDVWTVDKTQVVGRISKQWGGFLREAFTDADKFGIQFPVDLDVAIKATLIGALFLIDFMYFEN